MPPVKDHIKSSMKRTGKSFAELHRWMDDEYEQASQRQAKHDIVKIPHNMEIVEKKFGSDAVHEFLQHTKEDYENNSAYSAIKRLSAAKRALLLPIRAIAKKTIKPDKSRMIKPRDEEKWK